jgi:long-chain fatty acid transport protein
MRRALRVSALTASLFLLAPATARATGVLEFPDNGSEQMARGGAWVARASDPLATFYNPAGLAGQPTRLTLQANITNQGTCFTRVKANNDTSLGDGATGGTGPAHAGGTYPQVCQDNAWFPDPQLAFTYRLTDRIGLGIAVLGPSAAGNVSWPEFINGGTTPSPQRYLLIKSNVVLLTPTIGVGWEPIDNLRVGASFIFGTAPNIDFVNASPAQNVNGVTVNDPSGTGDLRGELKAHDYFIPGFTVGTIWTPIPQLDVAAWYKYMAPIDATGDAVIAENYFGVNSNGSKPTAVWTNTNEPACFTPNPKMGPQPAICGSGNNASVKVPLPMEAKIGARFHMPRSGVDAQAHMRDPMAQDVFDIEADVTWANDSAFDYLQLRFPGTDAGLGKIPVQGTPGALPPNADMRHHFSDVIGVRLGGDYNILPDQLSVRAGGFFESQAADPTYQNIDFDAASRFGLALGAQYRIKFGSNKLDFMAGYGHVFFANLSNTDPNGTGVPALTGEPCIGGNPPPTGQSQCPGGRQPYRTIWPVNLGTITSQINVINVGASLSF